MIGLDKAREDKIKSLPYEEAMKLIWMWIKQDVIDSPKEFINAVRMINLND